VAKQCHAPEPTFGKLRESEVEIARGDSEPATFKKFAVSDEAPTDWFPPISPTKSLEMALDIKEYGPRARVPDVASARPARRRGFP
jgi:hypothetical protein